LKALFQGQRLAQGLPVFLDAAAAGAGQIALMGGLEHQDQGEFFFTRQALAHEVAG
jgi:hypothetical protein